MTLTKPRLLVLDGQGVVFSSPIKRFLRQFSCDNGLDYKLVERRWEEGYRQLAWSGNIDDGELWRRLADSPVDVEKTMATLIRSYGPGPAAPHVSRWSQTVPVWLLSNHRSHWVMPKLDEFGVRDAFQRLLISDLTGFVKPEPAAFQQLLADGLSGRDILLVDDQKRNIEAAKHHGLCTIHADQGGLWLQEVELAIGGRTATT